MGVTAARTIDWERIELDYRAGVKTLRQIAEENDVTHGAINKRAKRDGWERDLSAKIVAKAESLVSKAEVSKQVSKEALVTERAVIEANAQAIADVILSHRKDIQRNRSLAGKMLSELEAQTNDPELFEQLAELMAEPDQSGVDKLNILYRKVLSLPSRIDSAKKLAETMRVMVALEREAFGVGAEAPTKAETEVSGEVRVSGLSEALEQAIEKAKR
mgnify:CR=1 FL=1